MPERQRPSRANTATKPCAGSQAGPCPVGAQIKANPRWKRCRECGVIEHGFIKKACEKRNWDKYKIQRAVWRQQLAEKRNNTFRPCPGAGGRPCPDKAQIKDGGRRKRCKVCSKRARREQQKQSFKRNWPKYREQRKGKYHEMPQREALFRVAESAGLLGRAA